jgi:glycosyltransferase involved in cell wall biosynthesis
VAVEPIPLVTIAMSMHNAALTIDCAIRSVLAQGFADWELIVFDDGSTDRSAEIVRGFADQRIRIHADGKQLGLAARLNQAIDLAHASYFARMDADDVAYPDRLARQVEFLQSNPQVDLLGAGMMVFAGDGEPVGLFPSRATHAEICARPFSGFYLAHPTWIGKREWFRRWRYDPACRKSQDQDLLLRSFSTSCFAVLPEPLVGYRQDALSIRKSALGRYYLARAILRVAQRDRRLLQGFGALAEQIAKLGYDVFAIATGLSRKLLRHRALPFTEAQASAWRQAWATCHATNSTDPGKRASFEAQEGV